MTRRAFVLFLLLLFPAAARAQQTSKEIFALARAEVVGSDRAIELYERYTRMEPTDAWGYLALADALIEKLNLKNDAALSRALEVAPPVISKIRHRRLPVGASLLIRMHEVSDLSIKDLRILMGDRRDKFRISDKQFKPKDAPSTGDITGEQHE